MLRRTFFLASAIMLIVSIGLGMLAIYTRNIDWTDHKPDWLLVFEVEWRGEPHRERAALALWHRHTATPIRDEHLVALIDPALDAQGRVSADWGLWMTFLEDAFAAGLLTEAQRARYGRQPARSLDMALPTRALADEVWDIPINLAVPQPDTEVRIVPSAPVRYLASLQAVRVDGQAVPLSVPESDDKWRVAARGFRLQPNPQWKFGPTGVAGYRTYRAPGSLTVWLSSHVEQFSLPVIRLSPGDHVVEFDWTVSARVLTGEEAAHVGPRANLDDVVARWDTTVRHEVRAESIDVLLRPVGCDVRPEPQLRLSGDSVLSSQDPSHRPIVVDRTHAQGESVFPHVLYMILSALDRDDDVCIAGTVLLRIGGETLPSSGRSYRPGHPRAKPVEFVIRHDNRGAGLTLYTDLTGYEEGADQVELVLVPDRQLAGRSGGAGEFWNETIVIRGLEIVPFE